MSAASLIYPADKIECFSSASLGQAMIKVKLLAEPDPSISAEAVFAILGRARLRDARVPETLLADRKVPNLDAPPTRTAETVEAIRKLLALQEAREAEGRERQMARITRTAEGMLPAGAGRCNSRGAADRFGPGGVYEAADRRVELLPRTSVADPLCCVEH